MEDLQRSRPFSILFLGLTMATASGMLQVPDALAMSTNRQVIQRETVSQCHGKHWPGGCVPKPGDIKKPGRPGPGQPKPRPTN